MTTHAHTPTPASVPPTASIPDRFDADTGPAPSLEQARAEVRALTTGHYENFSVLSRLVPPDYRDDFAAVYAFCRWSDDLADETGNDETARARSLDLLARWRGELEEMFAGRPTRAVFVALADTAERRGLRPEPMHRLIDAFEQDQRLTRYATWDELLAYCRGSADPVGHMVLQLGGVRPPSEVPANEPRYTQSDSICTALQLTNHWQDVRRDLLERDRVYLPSEETGLDAETLRGFAARKNDPEARVPFIKALRPLVERTDAMFVAGQGLPSQLEPWLGNIVGLLAAGGRKVLHRIDATGCTTLWKRPRLSKLDKALLVAKASLGARGRSDKP